MILPLRTVRHRFYSAILSYVTQSLYPQPQPMQHPPFHTEMPGALLLLYFARKRLFHEEVWTRATTIEWSNNIQGISFPNENALQIWLDDFFNAKPPNFYKREIEKLLQRWQIVVYSVEEYIVGLTSLLCVNCYSLLWNKVLHSIFLHAIMSISNKLVPDFFQVVHYQNYFIDAT